MPSVPPDVPDDTAVEVDWDRDHSSSSQDPDRVLVVIGKWEWKSMQKRREAEWTVDGWQVHVVQDRDEPGVMFETGGDPDVLRLHLTGEQTRSLREHGVVEFEDSRTFPFDVRVVRRE